MLEDTYRSTLNACHAVEPRREAVHLKHDALDDARIAEKGLVLIGDREVLKKTDCKMGRS